MFLNVRNSASWAALALDLVLLGAVRLVVLDANRSLDRNTANAIADEDAADQFRNEGNLLDSIFGFNAVQINLVLGLSKATETIDWPVSSS